MSREYSESANEMSKSEQEARKKVFMEEMEWTLQTTKSLNLTPVIDPKVTMMGSYTPDVRKDTPESFAYIEGRGSYYYAVNISVTGSYSIAHLNGSRVGTYRDGRGNPPSGEGWGGWKKEKGSNLWALQFFTAPLYNYGQMQFAGYLDGNMRIKIFATEPTLVYCRVLDNHYSDNENKDLTVHFTLANH